MTEINVDIRIVDDGDGLAGSVDVPAAGTAG